MKVIRNNEQCQDIYMKYSMMCLVIVYQYLV